MRTVGAYGLIFLFVCLNLGAFIVNEYSVLGEYRIEPYETPETIQEKLANIDSATGLFMGATTITVGAIITYITGSLVYGGTASLVIFSLEIGLPVVRWVIAGFPTLLLQIGAPPGIVTVVSVLTGIVWLWFIFSVLSGRITERD